MGVVEITAFDENGWKQPGEHAGHAAWFCEHLERGNILLLPDFPVVTEDHRRFLTQVRQRGSAFVKNISYETASGRLRGFDRRGTDAPRLKSVLSSYADRIRALAADLLAPYAGALQVDFTSFRPIEEHGRDLRGRSRNDQIHIDSFPTRPTGGRRILRFFTNVHPAQPRVWLISSENFEHLARRMAPDAGLAACAANGGGTATLKRMLAAVGIRSAARSPYDRFMLRFHDYLKAHREFQASAHAQRHEFPAGSTWIAFTDMVAHSVLSGQYALEQTFFLPVASTLAPQRSPLRILESIAGAALADVP
jgi:hypothetical protein